MKYLKTFKLAIHLHTLIFCLYIGEKTWVEFQLKTLQIKKSVIMNRKFSFCPHCNSTQGCESCPLIYRPNLWSELICNGFGSILIRSISWLKHIIDIFNRNRKIKLVVSSIIRPAPKLILIHLLWVTPRVLDAV